MILESSTLRNSINHNSHCSQPPPPGQNTTYHKSHIQSVKSRWTMPLKIHRTFPANIHWTSDNPLENTTNTWNSFGGKCHWTSIGKCHWKSTIIVMIIITITIMILLLLLLLLLLLFPAGHDLLAVRRPGPRRAGAASPRDAAPCARYCYYYY